jgi:hypothetical protein
MLQYTEALLREIRKLRADTEAIVLNGTITDMERYRFLMGRLEGLKLSEDAAGIWLRNTRPIFNPKRRNPWKKQP